MLTIPQGESDADGVPSVPGEHAIAHHLIRSWANGFSFEQLAPPAPAPTAAPRL